MRRKKSEFVFPSYEGISPKMEKDDGSIEGNHGYPPIGVMPHAEDSIELSPSDLSALRYPSGETVEQYASTHGFQSAIEKAISEGLEGREDKEIPGEIIPLDIENQEELKAAGTKIANISFDILDSINVFFKRIPTLFKQNELLIGQNELIGSTEATEFENEEEKYQVILTIPDISGIFSDILGYTVVLTEEDVTPLLDTLMVDNSFEDALYLVFQNSEDNKIYGEKSGVNIEIPVERAFFDIERIDFENDSLMVTIMFSVRK